MFNAKDKVQDLKDKSIKVLNIFTQTVQELSRINVEVELQMSDRETKIEELRREGEILTNTLNQNLKIIEKINDFIEN